MSDFYLGEIRSFAFGVIPRGWLPCDGRTLQIQSNQALYALLGITYGGDGKNTFMLPDLQGRLAMGKSPGNVNPANANPPTSAYPLGSKGGAETASLTVAQMPAHNHNVAGKVAPATSKAIPGNYLSTTGTNATITTQQNAFAAPGTSMIPLNSGCVLASGSTTGHPNMQPFLVTNVCIAVTGLFPSRN